MTIVSGSTFAGYVVERRLGTGGMGSVYAARHPRLPRRVALKLLSEGLGGRAEFRARFEREAELAARLDHPNVVAVYDRGIEDDQPWIAMQLVDGMDLDQLLQWSPHAISPERAAFILSEAAKGLDHAHRHGLLHRDIKPANILVAEEADDEDKVLVTDFGIARALDQTVDLTSAGSSPSTLPFASPEQIEGKTLDHRSDIYSLGCTLYVMLTRCRPFPRESALAVMNAHLFEPPPRPTLVNPSLPATIDAVIAKAMAKNPADRYSTCRQFAAAAAAALSAPPAAFDPTARRSDPSQPTPAAFAFAQTVIPPRALKPGKAKWGILAGAGVAVGAVVAATTVVMSGQSTSDETGKSVPVVAAPTATQTATPPPWGTFDFVAKALPGFLPETPSGTNYAGDTCGPVDAQYNKIRDFTTPLAVARIRCGDTSGSTSKTEYILVCYRDGTPYSDVYMGDGVADLKNAKWSRNGQSGTVTYGTGTTESVGMMGVTFDSPSRNFCQVWVYGPEGSTGQQVYDQWLPAAPIGETVS